MDRKIKYVDLNGLKYFAEELKSYLKNHVLEVSIFNELKDKIEKLPIGKGEADNSAILKGENNQAISEAGVALGSNNIVGLKGFYYKHIRFVSNAIANVYLSRTQVIPTITTGGEIKDTTINPFDYYSIGDIVSIINDNKYDNIAVINNMSPGMIQIKWNSESPFTAIKKETDWSPEDYTIYSLDKVDKGLADIGKYSFATGTDNKAINSYAEVSGTGNIARSKFAKVWGKNNIGGYNTTTFGTNNINLADNSFVNGTNNTNEGNNSVIHGNKNKNYGKRAFVVGNENITNNDNEAAFGKYNNSKNDTQFSIGIGTSDTDRKNVFEINNGKHYIYGVGGYNGTNPDEFNDIASTIKNLDTKIDTEIDTKISNLIDSAPETLDTLKEIADWIVEDETNSAELVKQVENNTKAIEDFSNMSFETTTNTTTVSETIPVAGGPLSDLLIAKGITSIDKNANLQDVFLTLFCKEEFPSISISTSGTFTGKSGLNGTTITCKSGSTTLSNSALVEPGTKLKFTVTQGSISGTYGSTPWSISGFKHGYSLDDDDTVYSTNDTVTHNWNVSGPNNTSYTLDATLDGTSKNASGSSAQTITFDEISAKIGNNTCSTTSKGTRQYTGTMEGFPTYYVVSNLGKTTDYDSNGVKRFTDPIEGKTTTVTSGNSSGVSSSKTIIGVYPVYHNVSSSSLGSDTTTKMSLSTSTSYTISNVPSEEASGKQFIFDFPENATVSSMSVKPLPGKYNVYSNISGNSIGSSLDYNHGVWKSSMVFNAAKESGSARFAIEFPASTNVTKVLRLNDATGKDDVYTLYKIESVKRGSDSYKRLTMTHDSAQGVSKYTISFETPGAKSDSDYTIESGVTKTINGTVYNYKRLITTSQQGWVDRTITFSKSLNNIS